MVRRLLIVPARLDKKGSACLLLIEGNSATGGSELIIPRHNSLLAGISPDCKQLYGAKTAVVKSRLLEQVAASNIASAEP